MIKLSTKALEDLSFDADMHSDDGDEKLRLLLNAYASGHEEISRLKAAQEWQPIETAPDGVKMYAVYTAADKSEGVMFADRYDAEFAAGKRSNDAVESTLADSVKGMFDDYDALPLDVVDVEITPTPPAQEEEWEPIETAPIDGTPIQAEIPGNGADNVIAWIDCLSGHNDEQCFGWAFVTEQEPPDCWTDGICWTSNEDGKASVKPTRWKPLAAQEGSA